MGISVIPSFAATPDLVASPSSNGLSGGLPGEFAALLTGEIKNLTERLPGNFGQDAAPASLGAENGTAQFPLTDSRLANLLPGSFGREVALASLGAQRGTSRLALADSRLPLPLLAKTVPSESLEALPGKAGQALQLAAEGLARRGLKEDLPKTVNQTVSISIPEVAPKVDPVLADELKDESLNGVDPALIAALTGHPAFQPKPAGPDSQPFEASAELPGRRIAGDLAANANQVDSRLTNSERSAAKAGDPDFSSKLDKLSLNGNSAKGVSAAGNEAANLAVETSGNEAIDAALLNNGAAALSTTPKGASEVRNAQQYTITPHIQGNNWSQHFGEKVVWLAKSDQQSAQININPPQLGPIQITLNLSGDQATMSFASPHLDVRQAIESALPQLKEMLSSAGINLGQADVGANMAQHKQETPFQSANGQRRGDENAILPANEIAATTGTSQILQRGRGLVDLFA